MYTSDKLIDIQRQLTRIAVSEFGFLHPKYLVNPSMAYYEDHHWIIRHIPDTFRKRLSTELREPDIDDEQTRNLLGRMLDAIQPEKVNAFANLIDEVAYDEQNNLIYLIFFNKTADWMQQTVKWFDATTNFALINQNLQTPVTWCFQSKIKN